MTLTAHSHGSPLVADVPTQSRGERTQSFDPADFPMPTGREEEWRFTPLDRISAALTDLDHHKAPGQQQNAWHSDSHPAATITGITDVQARALSLPAPGDRAAALTTHHADQILHVNIPDEAVAEAPIRLRLNGIPTLSRQHVVITAGRFSRAVVVIEHAGPAIYTEVISTILADGADLTVVSVQQWDDNAVHLGQHDAVVGRDAHYRHVAITLGGRVVRLNTNVRYAGPGGDATLLGVYFANAGQHLEHRSFVDHAAPHCRSEVMYKGALQGDTARTVWVGDVLIRAEAEGTDTYELNRNLVLTDGARADSVPNLEIETGEIAGAGHASATGRFDDEQLFYLQARGIPEAEARRLVVRGFFADIVDRIGIPDVSQSVMSAIEAELAGSLSLPHPSQVPS
ncbi:MAG: Fe-S cluster assembly protein SufD [Actinomycetota bacterium]